MPINIEAIIVDIRKDKPRANDVFMVDSNVWYWFGYSQAYQSSKLYQVTNYPRYLNQVSSIEAKLVKSPLSFSELAHSIEHSEFQMFTNANPNLDLDKKRFRQNYPQEREAIINEVVGCWNLATAITIPSLEIMLYDSLVQDIMNDMGQFTLDAYDLMILKTMQRHQISQIITDDADFGQIPNIQVFTANNYLIREAQKQDKLISR